MKNSSDEVSHRKNNYAYSRPLLFHRRKIFWSLLDYALSQSRICRMEAGQAKEKEKFQSAALDGDRVFEIGASGVRLLVWIFCCLIAARHCKFGQQVWRNLAAWQPHIPPRPFQFLALVGNHSGADCFKAHAIFSPRPIILIMHTYAVGREFCFPM